jgi:acyl-CoA thioesterase-1
MATVSPAATANEISCRMVNGSPPLSTLGQIRTSTPLRVSEPCHHAFPDIHLLLLPDCCARPNGAGRQNHPGLRRFALRRLRHPPGCRLAGLAGQRLQEKKLDYSVVNASISGETTSRRPRPHRCGAGQARHRWSSRSAPTTACAACRWRRCATTCAMSPAPSSRRRRCCWSACACRPTTAPTRLSSTTLSPKWPNPQTALVDFLLEGVATQAQLFQADNLHPTAEAQPLLLDNVWRGLAPLLK